MKNIYLTPGPSALLPCTKTAMIKAMENDICSISHRSKDFEEIYKKAEINLKKLLLSEEEHENWNVFFISSATEAMERLIENCVLKKSSHFVNGSFSDRFFQTALELNKKAEKIEADFGKAFGFDKCSIDKMSELLCFTHNETSSGVCIDLNEVKQLKNKYPDKLFALDIVSSAPCVNVDTSIFDSFFFSVQKGFGMPAGLGILFVNDKCLKKSEEILKKKKSIGSYHNFQSLLKKARKNQTPETPNVLAIYLIGKVSDYFLEISKNKLIKKCNEKAEELYSFLDKSNKFNAFVKDERYRSKTVITIECDNPEKIINEAKEKGFVLGKGYGKYKSQQIRVANFPVSKKEDIIDLIKILHEYE